MLLLVVNKNIENNLEQIELKVVKQKRKINDKI